MDLALLATIAAVVSALGGLLATCAAFRSAGLARSALDNSTRLEQRRMCDALVQLAQEVRFECTTVASLLSKLEIENQSYAVLTGNSRGSWIAGKSEELSGAREAVEPIAAWAAEWSSNYSGLLALDEEGAAALRVKLLSELTTLSGRREDLVDQLREVRSQNNHYRADR